MKGKDFLWNHYINVIAALLIIHDSLHSRAIQQSPLGYTEFLKSARALASPLPAVIDSLYRDLIPL